MSSAVSSPSGRHGTLPAALATASISPTCLALPQRDGLAALREGAWVSAPAPSNCREMLLHACRNAGFTPRVGHACADLRSGFWLVATGQAVPILPKLLCDAPPPGVAVRELPGPGRTLDVRVRAGTETQPAVAATLAPLTSLTPPAPPSPPALPAPLTAR
ncbi:LysR substrate-binding domain-containing protein [Streptomyces sp. NPDC048723]|uniref:LysR substrate-binding domain-containing protein n=1 Tax=Streptomyces sp. NPDC048723 TaxID=3365589 RepID=UPI0037165795